MGILASCPYNESNNTKILTSNKTRFRSINNENKEEHQSKEKGNQRIDMCAYTKKAVYVRETDNKRKSSAIYTLQHICPESNLKLSINRVFFFSLLISNKTLIYSREPTQSYFKLIVCCVVRLSEINISMNELFECKHASIHCNFNVRAFGVFELSVRF